MMPMDASKKLYFRLESWIVTRFLKHGPGSCMKFLFKLPILQYLLGLQAPIAGQILILTTTGRKSGKKRRTALGYGYDAYKNAYSVMTGWGGKSDWYQNALKDPHVEIWAGKNKFQALAKPVPSELAVEQMKNLIAHNPYAAGMLGKLAGKPHDGSDAWYQQMIAAYPSLFLYPLNLSYVAPRR